MPVLLHLLLGISLCTVVRLYCKLCSRQGKVWYGRLFNGCCEGSVVCDVVTVVVCRAIAERPVCSETGARLHFVDDRLDTLLAVQQSAELKDWNLYLADW